MARATGVFRGPNKARATFVDRDDHFVQQVVDRLVAGGRHGDALAAADQRRDQPRASVGLAGAGRSLDEQIALVERRRQLLLTPDIHRLDRGPGGDAVEAGGTTSDEVASDAMTRRGGWRARRRRRRT